MRWYSRMAVAASFLSLAVVGSANAQASIFFGGGVTIPTSTYKDFGNGEGAKTGWVGMAGVTVDVGDQGIWVGLEGAYGSNKHEGTSGDKTNIISALGLVGYTFQTAGKVKPYIYGGAGYLGHKFKSGTMSSEDDTTNQFDWVGSGGLSFELSGRSSFWVEGRYNGAKETRHIGVQAGFSIGVGGSN